MKRILTALSILLFMLDGYSQPFMNMSCSTAAPLCESQEYIHNLEGNTTFCTQPLFYYFHYNSTTTNYLHITAYGQSGAYTLYKVDATTISSETCAQVNGGGASIISSSSFAYNASFGVPYNEEGLYILQLQFDSCSVDVSNLPVLKYHLGMEFFTGVTCPDPEPGTPTSDCEHCITSFSPTAGKYIVSAWVSEDGASMNTVIYENASIGISFTGDPTTYNLSPTGRIIDGWQQIQQMIEVPANATEIHLNLSSGAVDTYFDDIRFHPLDGSMVSFVYDPHNLRLMAKLDERNYATFYEYDEEGKLVRVKKETERGVMTIQENRDNIRKQ